MPVPSLITDLSTTVASNSPSGSDNVFPDLDNYLRALSGFVASIRDNSGNGWTSPYLPLTYSAGTANGVLYLNGSKVVTTGSGLVFDGTNLGIGTTSPGSRLDVASTTDGDTARISFPVSASGTNGGALQFRAWTNSASLVEQGRVQVICTDGSASYGAAMRFMTAGSGSLSERARITSGGDLLVGTTNAAATTGVGVKTIASGSVYAVGATSDYFSGYNSSVGAFRFYVGISGTISATNTTISAISDQRLKENIRDIDAGLDKIMALKPRKFDWKAGKGQDKKDVRGFIAQEFEQVFPDLIDEWKDPAPEGEEPYKAVRADLIPVLVKAIQELKAQNDDLRARVAALEAA